MGFLISAQNGPQGKRDGMKLKICQPSNIKRKKGSRNSYYKEWWSK
jgi:hypothetical protein